MFITLEGPDGSGKTTQAVLLVDRLRATGREVVAVHEPGGTDLGVDIRALLVRRNWTPIDSWAEALLFSACRAQLVAEVIRPGIERGAIVVADRFADSTLAYQGAGRGLPRAQLQSLIGIATQGLRPDVTLLLDVPTQVGITRLNRSGKVPVAPPATSVASQLTFFEELRMPEGWNRFEDESTPFHGRVRQAYLDLAQGDPDRWVIVDGARAVDEVAAAVWDAVKPRLPGAGTTPALTPTLSQRERGVGQGPMP